MVEDDPDIQIVARMALEIVGGFTVEICSGGQQALDTVEGFDPDLVLLDVMMPDMDGPTVLHHLRARPLTAPIPIVFMTAKAQAHEIDSYLDIGAMDVISKPFDPMTLSARLSAIWQNSRARADARQLSL